MKESLSLSQGSNFERHPSYGNANWAIQDENLEGALAIVIVVRRA